MQKIRIGICAFSMGNGHLMKAIAIDSAIRRISKKLNSIETHHELFTEKNLLTPAAKALKDATETIYNKASRNQYLRRFLDKATSKQAPAYLNFANRAIRIVSRITFARQPEIQGQPIDAMISTYPFADTGARLPEIPVVRLLPDIYGHTLYFLPNGRETWYAVPDERLAARIKEGKEKYLHHSLKPSESKVVFTGAFSHPENMIQKKISKIPANIMFQIGGAGAQQEVFLEAMRHIDYIHVSPLFVAYNNREYFERLLERGNKLGLITRLEHNYAKSRSFHRLSYEASIMKFQSGLRILYSPDKLESIYHADTAKGKELANFAKPGDITSASILHFFLYPIGTQEVENAKWATGEGFAKWLIPYEDYKAMSSGMSGIEVDKIFGKKAAEKANEIAKSPEMLSGMHSSLLNMDSKGSYNTAALAMLLAAKKKGANPMKLYTEMKDLISLEELNKGILESIR